MKHSANELSPKITEAFHAALSAAEFFIGNTAPNPPVGAAILDADENLLSVGAHEKAGLPHAEPNAIGRLTAEQLARAHTMLVTFEPCNHHGRTGPCSAAILKTPIRKIIFAVRDPLHGGAESLRSAGCEVTRLPDEHPIAQAALSQLTPFLTRVRTQRPFVAIKTAHRIGDLTSDAVEKFLRNPLADSALFTRSMIPPAGQKTFTSPQSLKYAHALRRASDAFISGAGTIVADNPEFTVRHVTDHSGKQRILLVAEGSRKVPDAWLQQAAKRGFLVGTFDPTPETWDTALAELGARGVLRVLVEAGPKLTRWVIESGTWNEHHLIASFPGKPDQIRVLVNVAEQDF